MSSNANHNYKEESQKGFWTNKNRPAVIGDVLGREPSLLLISPKQGDLILDAGSGSGYMSRKMARMGARVIGMEINSDMIEAAKKINEEENLPILYVPGDIAGSDLGRNIFDTVICVAVLFHLTRGDVENFFKTAYMALKPGGKLVISYTSKKLMDTGEGKDLGWVQYSPTVVSDGPSVMRTESYKNANNDTFVADVWGHETEDLVAMLTSIGFYDILHQEQPVTAESLKAVNATGEAGLIAFEQVCCKKPSKKLAENL